MHIYKQRARLNSKEDKVEMVGRAGFEPATNGLKTPESTSLCLCNLRILKNFSQSAHFEFAAPN